MVRRLSNSLLKIVEAVRYESPMHRRISNPSEPSPTAPPLSLIKLKYIRAHEQFSALDNEIWAWRNRERPTPVIERSSDRTEYALVLELRELPDLERWAILIGEILFNLRSTLDHLVYALAIEESGINPPKKFRTLAFPITSNERDFNAARARGLLTGLSDKTIAFIESVQPYEGRNQILATLRELNDIDKHRSLNVVAMNMSEGDVEIVPHDAGTRFEMLPNVEPLKHRTRLMHIKFTEPYRKPLSFGWTLGAYFRESASPNRTIIELLRDMFVEVKRITKTFCE